MEKNEILAKLQEVFIDVLENEDIELTLETTADDIEEWDSLSHIQLVVAIEKALCIKFTSIEIQAWESIGDIINSIMNK